MLMLGASDKGVEQDAPLVTGKLGMGFKSIFLITDRPRVLSGSLCFEVLGAVFPQRLTGPAYEALANDLHAYAPNRKGAGTLICLPLQPDLSRELTNHLARFEELAPLLLAFSRKIKRIDLKLPGHQDRALIWQETPVLGLPHAFTGRLPAGRDGVSSRRALLLRGRSGTDAVLLRLGARGVEPFPAEMPGIWVTAPTTEGAGFGFAINGPFDLDLGRATLARISPQNTELADRLGVGMGEALVGLFEAGEEWGDFRQALDLASDVRPYDFWNTVVKQLAAPFTSDAKPGQERPDTALAQRALWGNERHGAARLLAECAALPNGLWGEYELLVRIHRVKHRVRGVLAQEAIFLAFSALESFRAIVAPDEIAADAALGELPILAPAGAQPLDLTTVLRWEIQPSNYCVSPEQAERFGAVVTDDAVKKLEYGGSAEQAEYHDLRSLLDDIHFRARDGSAKPARELLLSNADDTENDDEPLRASFAPASNLLAGNYANGGIAFFKMCREPQGFIAPAQQLAKWGRAATDDAKRVAFLTYLLVGDLGPMVGRQASIIKSGSWLAAVEGLDVLDRAAPTWSQRLKVLTNLELIRQEWYQPPSPPPPLQTLQPREALEGIFDWWQKRGPGEIIRYEQTLYSSGQQLSLSKDFADRRDDLRARKAWLELLILGAAHTLGRTQDGQHRGFLKLCHDNGWMATFATPRHEYQADAWMQAVHDYLDPQVHLPRYYHWMRLFVPIFQLSWWLDDYVDLFLNADRLLPTMPFDQFLAPNTAGALQGGGIIAPPLARTISTGAHFLLREMARGGLIENEGSLRHCYVPSARVRALMQRLGCHGLSDDGDSHARWSQEIYAFLKAHLGQERATFNNTFDIPLSIVARDAALQHMLFNSTVVDPAELFADEDDVSE